MAFAQLKTSASVRYPSWNGSQQNARRTGDERENIEQAILTLERAEGDVDGRASLDDGDQAARKVAGDQEQAEGRVTCASTSGASRCACRAATALNGYAQKYAHPLHSSTV
jgi:hypothetical protein